MSYTTSIALHLHSVVYSNCCFPDYRKYDALIDLLHTGEQCGTCGVRFASNSSEEYEKHLDWHYRLNKTDGQTTTSRNWFLHPEVTIYTSHTFSRKQNQSLESVGDSFTPFQQSPERGA